MAGFESKAGMVSVENGRIYRTLVETSREGIALVDVEGGIIEYCNDSYAEILDSSPPNLSKRSFFDFVDEEQENNLRREREARLRGIGSNYEVTISTVSGQMKHISATGSPVLDSNGDCIGAVHTILDISERKESEKALRESEHRFRTIFDAAGAGMAQVALDGRWLRVNRKLCEITDYNQSVACGRASWDQLSCPTNGGGSSVAAAD